MKYRDIHQMELQDLHGRPVSLLDIEKKGPFQAIGFSSKSRSISIHVQEFSLEFPSNSNVILWLHTNASYYRVHSVGDKYSDDGNVCDNERSVPMKLFNFVGLLVNEFIRNDSVPLQFGGVEQISNVLFSFIKRRRPSIVDIGGIGKEGLLEMIEENRHFIQNQLGLQPIGPLGLRFMEMLKDDMDTFVEEMELIIAGYGEEGEEEEEEEEMIGTLSSFPKDPLRYDLPTLTGNSPFKCPFCPMIIGSNTVLEDLIVHIKEHERLKEKDTPLLIEWPSPFPSKMVVIMDDMIHYY